MKSRHSIAGWLTSWFFISSCVLMVSGSSLLYWSLVEVIHREEVGVISGKIQTLQSILFRKESALEAAKRRIESEWAQVSPDKVYVRLKDSSGRIISISPNTPPNVVSDIFDKPLNGMVWKALQTEQAKTSYLAQRAQLKYIDKSSETQTFTVDIATELTAEESILPVFRIRMILILLTEVLIAFIIGRKLAQFSLSPIKRIAARAANIGPANLHERIDNTSLPDELQLLVSTFNEMLERLSESFDRLSRFSSDIAHELRTPINNMRGEIEIALNQTRKIEEYEEVFASSLEEIDRISQITDSLLFLAKSENPQTQLDFQICDLKEELVNVAEFYETISAEAGVTLEVMAPEQIPVRVNRTLFRQAIANLVANAISHTPQGGTVTLKGRKYQDIADSGFTEVTVTDTGEGISAEHISRVFDRFYRIDPSRASGPRPGSGLGLAIVQGIIKLHSGKVDIQSTLGQGTTVRLLFLD